MENKQVIKAHFSNIKKELRDLIAKSEREIKIAVAWLTDEDLIRDLALKASAGISVHLAISNAEENFKSTKDLKGFIRSGGKLFISDKKFIHHKFCLIDESTLITGSYNWTYYAEMYNDENIIVIHNVDSTLKLQFVTRFNKICKDFCSETTMLENLKVIDATKLLTQIDEKEASLRSEFETEINYGTQRAKELKIPVNFNLLVCSDTH